MRNNLTEGNSLLQQIQSSLSSSSSSNISQLCEQLYSFTGCLLSDLKYHYLLFLAEVYAVRLNKQNKAQQLCMQVIDGNGGNGKIQGILKMSYLCMIGRKYAEGIKWLQKGNKNLGTIEEKVIFVDFCNRLIDASCFRNILRGMEFQRQKRAQQAFDCYSEEVDIGCRDDLKYFASKCLKELTTKNRNLSLQPTFSNQIIQNFQQNNQNVYFFIKKYFILIVQFLQKRQNELAEQSVLFQVQLQRNKQLAITYMQQILMNSNKSLKKQQKSQIQDCLSQLKYSKSMISLSMLQEFTQKHIPKSTSIRSYAPSGQQSTFKKPEPMKYTNSQQSHKHPVNSNFNFTGSYMRKVNATSEGSEKRYFYFKKRDLEKGRLKLYYCSKQQDKGDEDQFYDLRKLQKIQYGKNTKPLQRSECDKFPQNQCFSIIYDGNKSRDFYVPEKADYQNWARVLQQLQGGSPSKSNLKLSAKGKSKQKNKQKDKQGISMNTSKLRKTKIDFS